MVGSSFCVAADMLYVFQVDTGSMTIFDMSVALESVANLKQAIAKHCKIPEDKQVLLISGGYSLDPASRVCTYSAGTDTSPIFLFSKSSIESESPPLQHAEGQIATLRAAYKEMKEKVEGCLNMPPTFNTIVTRAQLAQQFYELAQAQKCRFECLVHEQHLQQQGWAAVVANLQDVSSVFANRAESFRDKFESYLKTRDYNLDLLNNFSHDLQLLSKIPVLPALLKGGGGSTEENSTAVTLLQWIGSKDNQNNLEQIANTCLKGLEQLDESMVVSLDAEVRSALEAVDNPGMKEIKGLEEWLFSLNGLMEKARRIVDEQGAHSQSLLTNQTNAANQDDPSVLPNLCASHVRQLQSMLDNYEKLCSIQERLVAAKSQFSRNLHFRLRWIVCVEKMIAETDGKIGIFHENLRRLKRHLEVMQQIHLAPSVYLETTVEVARRNSFSKAFLQWANSLSRVSSDLHGQEIQARKVFNVQITNHFLQTLFPGMEDNPPPFATKPPAEFDTKLPAIRFEDVESLRRVLPELSDLMLSASACEHSVPPLLLSAPKEIEKMDLAEKKGPCLSEPGGGRHEGAPLARAHSDGDIGETPRLASSRDFQTADFFIDESLPSSYTDSNNGSSATRPAAFAELQRQLQDKKVQLQAARDESASRVSQLSQMRVKLAELREWVQQLLKKDVVFVRDRILQDRCEFAELADKIGETVRRLLDKEAAMMQVAEEEKREKVGLLQRLELEMNKMGDAERELDLYRQKLKEQSWMLDTIKQDSQQMQARYSEAEKKLTLEHELELEKGREEIQCLNEALNDKGRELCLFWEQNHELSRTLEELQGANDQIFQDQIQRAVKEAEARWEVEKRELRESLERSHKSEAQSLRYRFKLACSTAMERSPSDSSLENIHMEKEVERREDEEGGKKKSVSVAMEEEAKRWQEVLAQLRDQHHDQMDNLKMAMEADKKAAVGDALAQMAVQKDKTIKELRCTETQLMHQHAQDRETIERLLRGQVDASSEMRDALSLSMQREREAREAHYHVESELLDSQHKLSEHLKKQVDLTLSVSTVMETSLLADQQVSQLKSRLYEKEALVHQLRQKMMELSVAPFIQSDKVSVLSCNVGEIVLVTYDDRHENYVVFILGSTLHFLHTDCLEALALQRSPSDMRTSWALAEVTGKEYCQARKSNNRYKVPMGKRFYRVKAKPWDKNAAILREQQRRATPSLLAKSVVSA